MTEQSASCRVMTGYDLFIYFFSAGLWRTESVFMFCVGMNEWMGGWMDGSGWGEEAGGQCVWHCTMR